MIFQLSTIFILLCFSWGVRGACHTCQSNYAVCHDDRRFTMCSEGISSDEMHTCPNGYVCTGETQICLRSSAANPVQPTCEQSCDLCNSPGKLFACIDEITFAYCFGGDVPDYSATGECPNGYVCNLGSHQVCTSASDVYPSCYYGASHAPTTQSPPTAPIATSDSTDATPNPSDATPANPTDATSAITPAISTENPQGESAFCKNKEEGLYKDENDPTCQRYIFCYILSGQYLENKYSCSGSEFFNDDTKECQVERPANC